MTSVQVGVVAPAELDGVVGVLARGMRDNPLHVAALGEDSDYRVRRLSEMFVGLVSTMPEALRADEDGTLVGVCGLTTPGACSIGSLGSLSREDFPPMSDEPGEQARIYEWLSTWGSRDPAEPHFHLGPVSADAGRQGQGIGSQMMTAFCERVDRDGGLAYLETDKDVNVPFYEKFGFETVDEADVIGVRNWFMRRQPR